jgi:hypothetical protein
MSTLNQTHPALYSNLTRMTDNISLAFFPRPEEDLVALLENVLILCYDCESFDTEKKFQIWKELHAIYDLTFIVNEIDQNSKFTKKFRNIFLKELLTETPERLYIPLLITRLKTHISALESIVNKIPPIQLLEHLSPFLAGFQNDSVQVPGQFIGNMEPNPDEHFLVDKFESAVIIVKSGRLPKRVFSLRGSNGVFIFLRKVLIGNHHVLSLLKMKKNFH